MINFKKINLMLMLTMLAGTTAFAAEGESVRRRAINTDNNEQTHEMEERTSLSKEEEEQRAREIDANSRLKKAYKDLQLDPTKKYTAQEVNRATDQTISSTRPDYSLANSAEMIKEHQEKLRIEEKSAREKEKTTRKEGKSSDYTLSGFDDLSLVDSIDNAHKETTNDMVSKMSAAELSTKLTSGMVELLRPETIKALTSDPEKFKALFDNKSALKALSSAQVKAIDANTLAKFASGDITTIRFSDATLTDFINKLSPQQAEAIMKDYDSQTGIKRFTKDAHHLFDKNQRAAIRNLAEIQKRFPDNVQKVSDTADLMYKLPDSSTEFSENLNSLTTKEKQFIANRYVEIIEKDFKKESNLIGTNTTAEKNAQTKLENFISEYINPSLQPNEFATRISTKGGFTRIEIIDMTKIDPTQSISDQIATLKSNGTIETYTTPSGTKASMTGEQLESSYAQWFSGRIDLSKPLEDSLSNLLQSSQQGTTFRSNDPFQGIDPKLKETIIKELTNQINSKFLQDPTQVDSDYVKYVTFDTLSKLSPAQVRELNLDTLEQLSSEQIKVLNTSKLSTSQLKVILQKMIKDSSVLLSDNQFKMLPKDSLQTTLKSLNDSNVKSLENLLKNSPFGKTISRELNQRSNTPEKNYSLSAQDLLVLQMKPNEVRRLTTSSVMDLNPEVFTKMTDDQIGYLDFDNIDVNKLSKDQNIALATRIDNDQLDIILNNAKGETLQTFTANLNRKALESLDIKRMESVAEDKDAVTGLAQNKEVIVSTVFNKVVPATEEVETTPTFVQALPDRSLDLVIRDQAINNDNIETVLTNISDKQAENISENAAVSVVIHRPDLITGSNDIASIILPQVQDFNIINNQLLKTETDPKKLATIVSSLSADQITNLKKDYFSPDKLLQPDVILSLADKPDLLEAFCRKLGKDDIATLRKKIGLQNNDAITNALNSRFKEITDKSNTKKNTQSKPKNSSKK
jgi:hypothetical protein